MKKEELKVGDKVKAIFRKYGRHDIIGEAWNIATDENALQGTWVSIRVTGGNMNDPHVSWLVRNKVNILVPISDVKEVLA